MAGTPLVLELDFGAPEDIVRILVDQCESQIGQPVNVEVVAWFLADLKGQLSWFLGLNHTGSPDRSSHEEGQQNTVSSFDQVSSEKNEHPVLNDRHLDYEQHRLPEAFVIGGRPGSSQ